MTGKLDITMGAAQSPPFDIVRAAYADLVVEDLEAGVSFYEDVLGMIVTERDDDVAYLRGWEEAAHHSLILRRGEASGAARIGFRVGSPADLEALGLHLRAAGRPVELIADEPGRATTLRTSDPEGFVCDFFATMDQVPSRLRDFDVQRGAPILRFDHVNLHVPEIERAVEFWFGLGFRCSEYIATDGEDERLTGAWLRRKPTVHDVAFTAGRGPRLHHFAYWIAEPAGILRALDQLAAAGHASSIERGPGRHGVSNAFFVYLRDPAGHRIELYSCDYYTGDPDFVPLRWSVTDIRCRTFWGTRAPDSWYQESSPVLDRSGAPLATRPPVVDERSEVLA